jgi:hypothetical protein
MNKFRKKDKATLIGGPMSGHIYEDFGFPNELQFEHWDGILKKQDLGRGATAPISKYRYIKVAIQLPIQKNFTVVYIWEFDIDREIDELIDSSGLREKIICGNY